jgi:hypothetical protein
MLIILVRVGLFDLCLFSGIFLSIFYRIFKDIVELPITYVLIELEHVLKNISMLLLFNSI